MISPAEEIAVLSVSLVDESSLTAFLDLNNAIPSFAWIIGSVFPEFAANSGIFTNLSLSDTICIPAGWISTKFVFDESNTVWVVCP